jgi:two-component system, chemotaxis family, protein-glutamate methylesterase/glutaminase
MPEKSVKVLVISPDDDSVFRFFSVLFRDTQYSLIKPAEGLSALDEVKRSNPAMVLLDIDRTPGARLMDLCLILAENPRPVLLVSRDTDKTRQTAVKGMGIGAVDILTVPAGAPSLSPEQKLRLMRVVNTSALLRVSPISYDDAIAIVESVSREAGPGGSHHESGRYEVVGVAISTGGPNALSRLIPALPADFPVPMVVVQHIIPGFIDGIIKRLDTICEVRVKLAEQDEPLEAGTVYFAPDKLHATVVNSAGRIYSRLGPEPSNLLFCPSADVLFSSMASACGSHCMAVIMTGMGHDGVEGIRLIKQAGGTTIAQDRQSSVIYGMARVAVDAKLIDHVVPLPSMAGEVYRMLSEEKHYHSEKEIFSS